MIITAAVGSDPAYSAGQITGVVLFGIAVVVVITLIVRATLRAMNRKK